MPEGPDGKTIIIVKKVVGHGGHHGGAWKVAYADFVTAMMALFMVLWLVNSASVVTRERIASYFKRPGVFEMGSGTPLEIGGGGILNDTFAPPAAANSQIIPNKMIYDIESDGGPRPEGFGSGEGEASSWEGIEKNAGQSEKESDAKRTHDAAEARVAESEQMESIASEIQATVTSEAAAFKSALGNVKVKIDQRGLHIEIMDTPKASMFNSGSAAILSSAEEQLMKIAKIIVKLPNPVDIEGHTDATPFRAEKNSLRAYDNWDLSVDRANSARRLLERAGLQQWQLARIVGYGSQRLKNRHDPFAAANRRISISMRYTDQAAEALAQTETRETSPQVIPTAQTEVSKPAPAIVEPEKKEGPKGKKSWSDLDEDKSSAKTTLPKLDTSSPSQLKVEVKTTLPEGELITDSERPVRSLEVEKDKIFGKANPFFD